MSATGTSGGSCASKASTSTAGASGTSAPTEVRGLYPLDNAVVLVGHEKSDIRGMAWAQGYPKLPNRKTQTELRDIRVIEI